MLLRAEELGGTLVIRRSGMGGVRLNLAIPLPVTAEQGTRDDI